MAPTFETLSRFAHDYAKLTAEQRAAFLKSRDAMVADLRARRGFRPGLRVKRVRGMTDVWEMTWADDGRATWEYGAEIVKGEPHVIWRRIGTHDVFREP